MSSFKLIAISNRSLCEHTLEEQIKRIANIKKPDILILREKNLTEVEYELLAKKVIALCRTVGVECILHTFIDVARHLEYKKIHLPLHVLKSNPDIAKEFKTVGASVHSEEEAAIAEKLGVTYVTASNVFETDCKPGAKEKGILWLDNICKSVNVPVYALGGISFDNLELIKGTEASGACMMSGYMTM